MRHWLAGDAYERGSKGFLGRSWDSFVPGPEYWREVYRTMKPGAHLLAFAGTRTWDLLSMAIRLAGFENRDTIRHHQGVPSLAWVFGSGFAKGANISKHIDRMRNDDIRPVCRFLRGAIESSAYTPKTIAERFGVHSRMVEHWAARDTDSQPSVPRWEQWLELKALLNFGNEMDAEVWRLNGRKGKPGEAWHEREVVGQRGDGYKAHYGGNDAKTRTVDITAPATDAAKRWEGWHTSLKPAWEIILVFRKPLSASSVARQVLQNGCGALNVDASRVSIDRAIDLARKGYNQPGSGIDSGGFYEGGYSGDYSGAENPHPDSPRHDARGRFPSNFLLSHVAGPDGCQRVGAKRVKGTRGGTDTPKKNGGVYAQDEYTQQKMKRSTVGHADPDGFEQVEEYRCVEGCAVLELDRQSGTRKSGGNGVAKPMTGGYEGGWQERPVRPYGDQGTASRYFQQFPGEPAYCQEPPESDNGDVLSSQNDDSVVFEPDTGPGFIYQAKASRRNRTANGAVENKHSTVKPTALMRYLLKMAVPPGGTVLDPFLGSGSTLVAACELGIDAIGIEQDPSYAETARQRIAHAQAEASSRLPL